MNHALRIGHGWDSHRLVAGRPLWLAGVAVPHSHGLGGHSDADVVLHALVDALLGAAGLGDIGTLFPDTDPSHRNAASSGFVTEALQQVGQRGWQVVNVDITVVAQAPKLAPYKAAMRARVAELLQVRAEAVNIKAKTAEGLGPVGQSQSMEAHVVLLLAQTG